MLPAATLPATVTATDFTGGDTTLNSSGDSTVPCDRLNFARGDVFPVSFPWHARMSTVRFTISGDDMSISIERMHGVSINRRTPGGAVRESGLTTVSDSSAVSFRSYPEMSYNLFPMTAIEADGEFATA